MVSMLTITEKSESERFELESKVLAAAFKQSIDLGDSSGADFAHKQLFRLLQRRQAPGACAPSRAGILLAEGPAALQNEMPRTSTPSAEQATASNGMTALETDLASPAQDGKNAQEQIYVNGAAEQPNLAQLFSSEGSASISFSNPLLNRQEPAGLISEIAKSKPQSLSLVEADANISS